MDIMITYKFANQTLRIVSPAIPEQAYFTAAKLHGHRLSPDHVIVPFKERGSLQRVKILDGLSKPNFEASSN